MIKVFSSYRIVIIPSDLSVKVSDEFEAGQGHSGNRL